MHVRLLVHAFLMFYGCCGVFVGVRGASLGLWGFVGCCGVFVGVRRASLGLRWRSWGPRWLLRGVLGVCGALLGLRGRSWGVVGPRWLL